MFRGERLKAGQWPHGERGEGSDGQQTQNANVDTAMIFFSFNPPPLVHPGGVKAIVDEPRGHIVIGEIGIERPPGTRKDVQDEKKQRQAERRPFYPGNDTMLFCMNHVSAYPRIDRLLVRSLSQEGHHVAAARFDRRAGTTITLAQGEAQLTAVRQTMSGCGQNGEADG